MSSRLAPFLAVLLAIVLLLAMSIYTVDQREKAVVFQLGEIKEIVNEPGLQFKWPLIQNVRFFDNQIGRAHV